MHRLMDGSLGEEMYEQAMKGGRRVLVRQHAWEATRVRHCCGPGVHSMQSMAVAAALQCRVAESGLECTDCKLNAHVVWQRTNLQERRSAGG